MDAVEVYKKIFDENSISQRDFLTFSGNTAFNLQLGEYAIGETNPTATNFTYYYKRTRDTDWNSTTTRFYNSSTFPTSFNMTGSYISIAEGEIISIKTNYQHFFQDQLLTSRFLHFYISGSANTKVSIYGNILSLINKQVITPRIFNFLFCNNSSLQHASGLLLPDITSDRCYEGMFKDCNALTSAPELPANNMTPYCYKNMFTGCRSLKTPPQLLSKSLSQGCYEGMFQTAYLTAAPVLQATTMQYACYRNMFAQCTNLRTAPALNATLLNNSCYQNMFSGCTIMTTPPTTLPGTQLKAACYKYMFAGCINMTSFPAMTATVVADQCCYGMFMNCNKVNTIDTTKLVLRAVRLSSQCYAWMFSGCAAAVGFPALNAPRLAPGCYMGMFFHNSSQTNIPDDYLPATTMQPSCYYSMFNECYNLNNIPYLRATTLTEYCYTNMFTNCYGFSEIGDGKISGTELALYCYAGMFAACIGLTTIHPNNSFAVIKSAGAWCFSQMFNWCTALTGVPAGFLSNMENAAIFCCYQMFSNCTSLQAGPSSIPVNIAEDGCFNGMFLNCSNMVSAFPLMAYNSNRMGRACYGDLYKNCAKLKAISSYADGWSKTVGGELIAFTSGTIDEFGMVFDGWVQNVPETGYYYYNKALSGNTNSALGPIRPDGRISQQGDYIHIPYHWNQIPIGSDGGGTTVPDETPYLWGGGTTDYVEITDEDNPDATICTVIPVPPGGGNYVVHIGGKKRHLNKIAAGKIKISDFPSGTNGSTFSITNGYSAVGGGTKWFPTTSQEFLNDLTGNPLIVYSMNNQDFKLWIKNGSKKGAFAVYIDDFESDSQYENFWNLEAGAGPKHLRGVFITNTENGGGIDVPGSQGAVARIYNLGTVCSTPNRRVQIYTTPVNNYVGISGQMDGLSGHLKRGTQLHDSEFAGLFRDWKALKQIKDSFILPYNDLRTVVRQNCFDGMFSGCTSLSSAPNWNSALSSTTLKVSGMAMHEMFKGCTSLRDVGFKNHRGDQMATNRQSILYACNAQYRSYEGMFSGCTALQNIWFTQEINPDEDGVDKSYAFRNMFAGCWALQNSSNSIIINPQNNQAGWYYGMFKGCNYLSTSPTFSETPFENATSECFQAMFSGCGECLKNINLQRMMPTQSALEHSYKETFCDCYSLNFGINSTEYIRTNYYEEPFLEDITQSIKTLSLGSETCQSMFRNCTSLVVAPILRSSYVQGSSYYGMFFNCSQLKWIINLSYDPNAYGYNWLYGNSTNGIYFCVTTETAKNLPWSWRYKIIPPS